MGFLMGQLGVGRGSRCFFHPTLTASGLAFSLYITTESVRRDSRHVLRFKGYTVVIHFTPLTWRACNKYNGMQAREAFRGNVQTQSQAAPDLSFSMSGLVALGFLTNDRASKSYLALLT
jgi:hypothetical protein